MTPNPLGTTVEGIVGALFDAEPDQLLMVNPSAATIERFVDAAMAADRPLPETLLLADDRLLKDVMDDFLVASRTADLVEGDALALRTSDDLSRSSLLVTDDRVVALVEADDRTAGLATDDEEFVSAARAARETEWDDADEFVLRTPAISRVRDTLATEIDSDIEGDFTGVLNAMETARGDGHGLDEVTVSLLVAAKNRVLLYDISKWGEDVGVASKATFSRTKTNLEDAGLIDTEKVPIEVGRPRLRLKLADERLRDATPTELADVAQILLA